jgi:nicotinate-nucleotide--dimethylbenzimidazole phosphoribosyltransferase
MERIEQTIRAIAPLDAPAMDAARHHQAELTKPAGSLGRLEALSIQLAGITCRPFPTLERKAILTLAADHGVAAEGVSLYPSAVTQQMVANFIAGGAAINVLARIAGARVVVADFGVAGDPAFSASTEGRFEGRLGGGADERPGAPGSTEDESPPVPPGGLGRSTFVPNVRFVDAKLARGTANLATGPAMSRALAVRAIEAGIALVADEHPRGLDAVATGEMGIANTTASSCLVVALAGAPVALATGRGTGLDDVRLAAKRAIVERALAVNAPDSSDPLGTLAGLGGLEIAGLVGVILGAAARRVVIVLDGFISGAAALVAARLAPAVVPYLIAGHRSAEPGHRLVLEELGLQPLLDLDLRLGEGTGAALAFPLLDAACRLLAEMATFTSASVSTSGGESG